jgi:histidine triad (HIT) family protein
LLIPKKHIDHFTDIDDELAGKMMQVAQKIGRNILKEFKPERIGYLVHGHGVPHAHLIIIPQHHGNDLTSEHFAVIDDGKIKFTVKHIPYPSREELDDVASRIRLTE